MNEKILYKNKETFFDKTEENNIPGFSNLVNKKISDKDKTDNKNELGKENTIVIKDFVRYKVGE